MQTGLVLPIPEAQAVIGKIRARHDPSARAGMPPHVTLLYPFMDSRTFDDDARDRLVRLCASTARMRLAFQRQGRFDDVLWLAPDPVGPVVDLISRLTDAFPAFPPYGGAFGEIVPHLTVAHGDPRLFDRVSTKLQATLATPIECRVEHAVLFGHSPVGWIELERFALTG